MNELSPTAKKFILHWGELGTRWGLNRTVAQIHALLYISPRALTAEEISTLLSAARSNVSNSLRELQSWGIVRAAHVLGDRRDHFETTKDVWELFYVILDERKRREIDPTLQVLRECAMQITENTSEDKEARKRIREMLNFFEETSSLYDEFRKIPGGAFRQLLRFKGQLRRLFSGAA
jgi:DNA-binding transcriptional regulator GbsR (MarR family)